MQSERRGAQDRGVVGAREQRIVGRRRFEGGQAFEGEAVGDQSPRDRQTQRTADAGRRREGGRELRPDRLADVAELRLLPGLALDRQPRGFAEWRFGLPRHGRHRQAALATDHDAVEFGADDQVVGLGQHGEPEAAGQQFEIDEALALGDAGGLPGPRGDDGDPLPVEVEPCRAARLRQGDCDAAVPGGIGKARRDEGLARPEIVSGGEFPGARTGCRLDRYEIEQGAGWDGEAQHGQPTRPFGIAERPQRGRRRTRRCRDRDALGGFEDQRRDAPAFEEGNGRALGEGEDEAGSRRTLGRFGRRRAARRGRLRRCGRAGGRRPRLRLRGGSGRLRPGRWIDRRGGFGLGVRVRLGDEVEDHRVVVPVGREGVPVRHRHRERRRGVLGRCRELRHVLGQAAAGLGQVEAVSAGDAQPRGTGLRGEGGFDALRQADRDLGERRQPRDLDAERAARGRRVASLQDRFRGACAAGEVGHDRGRQGRRKARPGLGQEVDEDLLPGLLDVDAHRPLQGEPQAGSVGIAADSGEIGGQIGSQPLRACLRPLGVSEQDHPAREAGLDRDRRVEGEGDAGVALRIRAGDGEQPCRLSRPAEADQDGERETRAAGHAADCRSPLKPRAHRYAAPGRRRAPRQGTQRSDAAEGRPCRIAANVRLIAPAPTRGV